MIRLRIIVLPLLLVLLSADATGQQPSRIGLRVEFRGDVLPRDCVPVSRTAGEVERDLSAGLVGAIIDSGYWTQFCWNIERYDPANEPHGLLRIALQEVPGDAGEINVVASVGPAGILSPPFAEFTLREGRGNGAYPRGTELQNLLNQRFTKECLSTSAKEELFHHLVRTKIPIGTGKVIHHFGTATGDPYGLILLPWDEFNIFGQAKFTFRYRSASGIEDLESEGTGLPDTVTLPGDGASACCLVTKHNRAPVQPLREPVSVYLNMTCQEILFLPPPTVPTCNNSESGAVTVPVFE